MDGFPFRAPLALRLLGRLAERPLLSGKPFPRGMSPKRPGLELLVPPADTDVETGAAETREILDRVDRVDGGERFAAPSPVVGPPTHDDRVTLHARHFARHAAMLSYPGAGAGADGGPGGPGGPEGRSAGAQPAAIRAQSACRKHRTRWSLTMPVACMKA